ncbi:MAG: hypothetical protein ABR611_11255 [Chthoniobacterales bacterium]
MPRFVLISVLTLLALAARVFATGLNFAGVPLTPGATVKANVPLNELEKSYLREGGNAVPPYTVATIAVPHGFDPKKSWPVLIVFSSSDHLYPNWYDMMGWYRRTALAEGWVLLTGDGPKPPPKLDSSGWRAGHALAALEALNRSFPGSAKWPVACAGQSGGAKRASYLAPMFAAAGYRFAGLFLEGINEEKITEGYRHFNPGKSFLRTPIFLSSGLRDLIATIDQQTTVKDSMQRTGFTNIRHVTFPGGHQVLPAHVVEALRWFRHGR